MPSLEVSIQVEQTKPRKFNLIVTIKNNTGKNIHNVQVRENLLTYTNVYFSTLSVDGVPVSFTRDVLNPLLYVIPCLSHTRETVLFYPISVYELVDQPSLIRSTVEVYYDKELNASATALVKELSPAPASDTRIAIVGAGLAGLTAAYKLAKKGLVPIIYEGSSKVGGRCYSGYFKDGEVYEHGGELIDSGHNYILRLINKLGLLVDNVGGDQLPQTTEYSHVLDYPIGGGTPQFVQYSQNEASYDFFNRTNPDTGLTIYEQMYKDANETYPDTTDMPWPLVYGDPDRAKELDAMSVDDYVNEVTAFLRSDNDGAKTKLGQTLKVAYTIQYGAEPCEHSSLNLVYLLGFIELPNGVKAPNIPSEYFRLFGPSDETYHTHGGNSRIVEKLLEFLQKKKISIILDTRLTKITHRNDLSGKYQLDFVQGDTELIPEPFDYVISAIPFSTYVPSPYYHNWGIDISQSDFSGLKKYAINHLAMGRNSKLNVQFRNRFWREEGFNGATNATSNPYLTTPCGGDNYNGPQLPIDYPGNPVGINVPPVHKPKKGAKGAYERLYQNTWEVSRAQPQKKGILVDYTGGRYAWQFRTSSLIQDDEERNRYIKETTKDFLCKLNTVIPGSTSHKNFKFEYDHDCNVINVDVYNWKEFPWQRGSYPFWQTQQYIAGTGVANEDGTANPPGSTVPFAGFEGVPEPYDESTGEQNGNFLFAGDQTTYDNLGYMNGAVESGLRVAKYIISNLAI